MATQLYPRLLTTEERRDYDVGYTIDHGDLTETTANTSMVFNLFKTVAGDVIEAWHLHLDPAFKDASDAAFNSTAISLGDEDSATRFLNAVQVNENGTEVIDSPGNTAFGYSAVKQVTATVAAMAAKALNDLDVGRAVIFLKLKREATSLGNYMG